MINLNFGAVTNQSKNKKHQNLTEIQINKDSLFWNSYIPSLIDIIFSQMQYDGIYCFQQKAVVRRAVLTAMACWRQSGSLLHLQSNHDSPAACLEVFSQFYFLPAGNMLNRQESSRQEDGIPEGNKWYF